MTRFAVDVAELHDASASASSLTYQLDSGNLPRGGIDGIGGAPQVEDAYSGFLGNWSHAIERITEDLRDLSNRLCAAADSYLGTDNAIKSAASPKACS